MEHKENIMRIGVPKEIKEQEYRVGITPGSVRALVNRGHGINTASRRL